MNVRRLVSAAVVAIALAAGVPAVAQKAGNAPKNATAQCGDGTYSTAKTERGACSKHGGVKTWFGPASQAPAAPAAPAPSRGTTGGRSTAATATAPKGSTGECGDGTFTRAKTQQGACSRHGGVKNWYAAATGAPAAPAPTATKTAPAPTAAPTPTVPAAPKPRPAPPSRGTTASAAGAPEGATAKCKDGTYSHSKRHAGACSHHHGVAEWLK